MKKSFPKVMGIINVNNESFYSNSRCLSIESLDSKLQQMLNEGAEIIDIGACSTRPGSTSVTLEQEWEYLEKPLQHIKSNYSNLLPDKFTISIDTFRSEIVKRSYNILGNFIVNDISAGEDDSQMLQCVGELKLPYIAMHKRGTPSTMQQLCNYPNGVVNEVINYFKLFEEKCYKYGIKDYILDPGFGFAKTVEQNYELFIGMPKIMEEIEKFSGVKRELLVGISRKTMIWKPLNITPDDALCATTALNLQALMLGANILRVHDVKEAKQCVKIWDLLSLKL
jgi:dihydropteroate synthase